MRIKDIFNDHDIRPWWIALAVLLVLLVGVQQVGAGWVETFQDSDYTTYMKYIGASAPCYQGAASGEAIYCVYGVSTVTHLRNKDAEPETYFAFTIVPGAGSQSLEIYIYDSGESQIWVGGPFSGVYSTYKRAEVVRSGTKYYFYLDGSLIYTTAEISTVPYYYDIGGSWGRFIDDVVYGSSTEHNVIGCPPQTWFVAKDIFQSEFSGLYSAVDTQESASEMAISYAADGGSATVTVTNIATGAVVNTTTVSTYAGIITYNLTEMLFESGAPYGQYRVAISGSTASDTFWYKAIATSGTAIQWDDTTYSDGDEATITFSISESNWDTDDYSYCVEIWDESLNEVESWAVPSRPVNATKTIDVNTANFGTSGTFYAVLTATDTSSGEEMLLTYDDATVTLPGSGDVIVSGTTYDATTNLTLTSCTVVGTQVGVDHSTTSDGTTGAYEISDLVTDWTIGMNASKANYTGYLVSFMPYSGGTYTVDIPLVPSGGPAPGSYSNATTSYYNSTTDGTAIGGICWDGPYWTLSEGALCTVSNATWNTSCTTGAGGWYQCNNIGCGGTYTLTCSKTGYANYTKSCSLSEGCFNREDCTLDCANTLTVNCKDLTSLALLDGVECTVSLDTGESTTTDTGTCTFSDLAYGSYVVTGSALGYYPGSTGVVMDAAKEVDVYLSSAEERSGGSGAAYAPKSVKFSVQTLWGKAITNCSVTCCGQETTAGSWSWLYSLFGIDANATPIANSTMTGSTDDRGAINFLMLEPVEYQCQFYKAGEINKNVTLYPKDEYYLIVATDYGNSSWFEGGVDINAAINCTVATSKINSTASYINFTYLDTTNATTGGTVYLNQTNTTVGGPPVTLSTCALSAGCSSGCNCSFIVTKYAGESYQVDCCPTHSTWDFTRSFTVTFPPEQVNPLGLTDTELMMIAMFFVIFTGCLFGAISAPNAPLAMCFMGWLMWALGWMDAMGATAVAALVLASVLSVLFLVMVRSKRERWV